MNEVKVAHSAIIPLQQNICYVQLIISILFILRPKWGKVFPWAISGLSDQF